MLYYAFPGLYVNMQKIGDFQKKFRNTAKCFKFPKVAAGIGRNHSSIDRIFRNIRNCSRTEIKRPPKFRRE